MTRHHDRFQTQNRCGADPASDSDPRPAVDSSASTPGGPAPGGAAAAVSDRLRRDRGLRETVVGHLLPTLTPCATQSGERTRRDVAAYVDAGVGVLLSALDAAPAEDHLGLLGQAGARWAREGVPIDVIHHAVHEGLKVVVRQHAEAAAGFDVDALRQLGLRLVDATAGMSAAIASAYMKELRTVAAERHHTMYTLATAMLSGRQTATMVRQFGIPPADSYFVIPLTISAGTRRRPSRKDDRRQVNRRVRAALQRALDEYCVGALSLLRRDGGVLLLPTEFGEENLDDLVMRIGELTNAEITAVVMVCDTTEIPSSYRWAVELLDAANRSSRRPGLYRFADLAVDYQLTRPGPGRESISALLRPLQRHPELLNTLTQYIRSDFSAKRTARALGIHQNTINYRFGRIEKLVGVDPSSSEGLWRLYSALAASGLVDLSPPNTTAGASAPGPGHAT